MVVVWPLVVIVDAGYVISDAVTVIIVAEKGITVALFGE